MPPIPETNPIDFLIRPSLSMETDEFHYLCEKGVTSSSDFAKAETRFMIKSLSVLKRTSQREFVLIAVRDGEDDKDRSFILESTVEEGQNGRDESLIEAFFDHEDSMKVLQAVVQTSLDLPSNIPAAGAAVVAGPAALSASALGSASVPFTSTFPLPFPEIDEPSSDSLSTKMFDNMTLNLTQILDFFSERCTSRKTVVEKLAKDAFADDRWLAGDRIGSQEYWKAQGARSFEPKHLTLLHMSILALVVHREYPIYSLFKNNDYWFSNIVYICAKIIDFTIACTPNSDFEDLEDTRDLIAMFYMPFHLYMPTMAGCWMRFKICEVQKIVVRRVVKLFFEELQKHEDEVSLLLSSYRMLLISLQVGALKAAESELRNTQAELENLRLRCEQFERMERLRRLEVQVLNADFSNTGAIRTQVINPSNLFCHLKFTGSKPPSYSPV